MQVLTLAANAWGWVEADWALMLHECAERCARIAVGCGEGDHALSLQAQEVEDERLLDFQLPLPALSAQDSSCYCGGCDYSACGSPGDAGA